MLAATSSPVNPGSGPGAPQESSARPATIRLWLERIWPSDNYKGLDNMNTENPYAPPRAKVSDVSDGSDELELAGRGVRLGAALLDAVILMVLIYIPLIFGGLFSSTGPGGTPQISPIAGLLAFVGFVVWIWFTIVYVSRNGQTIAKKWLGIKVVRTDGTQASLGRIFWLRNVVNGLLGIIPLYGLIDILLIFGDSRQCIHDKIADTIVVVA